MRLKSLGVWLFFALLSSNNAFGIQNIVTVGADIYGAYSGFYVRKGDEVRITSSGHWFVQFGNVYAYSPRGHDSESYQGCPVGSLVAGIGYFNSTKWYCIGESGSFIADRDGLLYLQAGDGWWLDENHGEIKAHIETSSPHPAQPSVSKKNIVSTDFSAVAADWVELVGHSTILSLPKQVVVNHQSEAPLALERLDQIYEAHRRLSGVRPFNGQRVRFFPDPELAPGVFAFMGNPIRYIYSAATTTNVGKSILEIYAPNADIWGWTHELGHNFIFELQVDFFAGNGEAWPNIFSMHSYKYLGLTVPDSHSAAGKAYLRNPNYEVLKGDPWVTLDFLMRFQKNYGWEFYQRFFRLVTRSSHADRPPIGASDTVKWNYILRLFNIVSGQDNRDVFREYKIPFTD